MTTSMTHARNRATVSLGPRPDDGLAGVLSSPEAAMPRNALYIAGVVLVVLAIAVLWAGHVNFHIH